MSESDETRLGCRILDLEEKRKELTSALADGAALRRALEDAVNHAGLVSPQARALLANHDPGAGFISPEIHLEALKKIKALAESERAALLEELERLREHQKRFPDLFTHSMHDPKTAINIVNTALAEVAEVKEQSAALLHERAGWIGPDEHTKLMDENLRRQSAALLADLAATHADLEKFAKDYVMDGEGLIERAIDRLARWTVAK